jgi:hypothetical protein
VRDAVSPGSSPGISFVAGSWNTSQDMDNTSRNLVVGGPIMKKFTRACAALALGILLFFVNTFPGAGNLAVVPAACAQNWQDEFSAVCSKTQDAMQLSDDELKSLIDRCDKLKPLIEQFSGAQAKIYLKRLAMCRDLYAYVLESRQNK